MVLDYERLEHHIDEDALNIVVEEILAGLYAGKNAEQFRFEVGKWIEKWNCIRWVGYEISNIQDGKFVLKLWADVHSGRTVCGGRASVGPVFIGTLNDMKKWACTDDAKDVCLSTMRKLILNLLYDAH